jgi:mRNA interferase RelE/StbE
MTRIVQTPTFKRAAKRLPRARKAELDAAIRKIIAKPDTGEAKKGDLAGVLVHKFTMNRQMVLLAYEVFELDGTIKLLALGGHENFYRDLKR